MRRPNKRFCQSFLVALSLLGCKTSGRDPGMSKTLNRAQTEANLGDVKESDFVVPKTNYETKITKALVTRQAAELARAQDLSSDTCNKTNMMLNRLVTKLAHGSNLEAALTQSPPLRLKIACRSKDLKLPEVKAGVLWLYPEILQGFKTEDQAAALLAHELAHYTRSHEEEIEKTMDSWRPFRQDAVNRARWSQEKEADRLTPRLLARAGFDPVAAMEVPFIVDELLSSTPGWQAGKINFPLDSMEERGYRIKYEIKEHGLAQSPQTIGQLPEVQAELTSRDSSF